jgi:hypothetical protein
MADYFIISPSYTPCTSNEDRPDSLGRYGRLSEFPLTVANYPRRPRQAHRGDSSDESSSGKTYTRVIAATTSIQQPLRENRSFRAMQYKSLSKRHHRYSKAPDRQPRDEHSWRRIYLKPDSGYLESGNNHSEREYDYTWSYPELWASENSIGTRIYRSARKKLLPCHTTRKLYNFNNSNACHSQGSAGNTEDEPASPPCDLRFAELWGQLKVSTWKRNAGRKKGWRCFPYTKSKRQDGSHDSETQSKHFRVRKGVSAEVGIMGMPLAALRYVGKPFIPRTSSRVTCKIQHRANKMRVADMNSLLNCCELYYGIDE